MAISGEKPAAHAQPRTGTRRFVSWGCAFAAAVGLAVCGGWILNIEWLTKVGIPGDNVVRLPTGLCFIIAALGILFSLRERTSWAVAYALRLMCAWFITGVGFVMLADHIIPDRYFDLAWWVDPAVYRTSFNTALALVTLGLSLMSPPSGEHRAWAWASRARRGGGTGASMERVVEGWEWWLCQGCAILAMLVGYIAMIGHLYNAEFLYHFAHQVNMSFPAALTVFVLGLCSLLREPDAAVAAEISSGMNGGKLLRWLATVAAVIVPLMGLVRLRAQQAGLVDLELGLALNTALGVVFIALAVWVAARRLNYAEAHQHFAQDELRRLNASLEGRVRDRTKELRISEGHFRLLADTAPALIWMTDALSRYIYLNKACMEFHGGGALAVAVKAWFRPLHPEDAPLEQRAAAQAKEDRHPYELQMRVLRNDGAYRWVHERGVPRFTPEGEFIGFIGACVDVTDSQLAKEELADALEKREEALLRERSLRRELDHRVRNNLASLLGLVSFYEQEASSQPVADVSRTLREKIRAMKDVHEVISKAGGRMVRLHDLLTRLLGAMVPDERRGDVTIGADVPVFIQATQASAFAMIFQELTTNSFKHGALSARIGKVGISWLIEDALAPDVQRVRLEWTETRAPGAKSVGDVLHDDAQSGTGLRLIEGFARSDLQGDCRFSGDSTSWRCTLWAAIYSDGAMPHAAGDPART